MSNLDTDRPFSERGRRANATRRENAFYRALRSLGRPLTPDRLAEIRGAAHVVSETIAAHLPKSAGVDLVLPRGYLLTANGWGEPALALSGVGRWGSHVLLNPSYTATPPDLDVLARFALDLREGWLRETLDATGSTLDFRSMPKREEIRR